MNVLIRISLLLVIGSHSFASSFCKEKLFPNSLVANKKLGGNVIEVTLKMNRKASISDRIWGDGGACDVQVVCDAIITINKMDTVWLPYSLFNDAVNFKSVNISGKNGDIFVQLFGGEAGTGYELMITLRRGCVVSRSIHSLEMGFGETTTYNYDCEDSEPPIITK